MSLKILAVEDDIISRLKLQRILERYGETHLAVNGEELITAFTSAHEEGDPYHLITVDIRLPDITGQEAVKQIRDWEWTHDVPNAGKEAKILMITAMDDGKNIMASFKSGCEAYVVKPINFPKIAEVLAKMGIKTPD